MDVSSDPANCGACWKSCDKQGACVAGKCTCPAPLLACGVITTRCIDAQTDRENCGACATRCEYKCEGGVCVDCPAGLGACFGACKNFANDNYNCGGCIRTVSCRGTG